MTTEKCGGESVPDAAGYTMAPAEVLARAGAFDPTDPHVSVAGHQLCIMRLALQMIVAQCGSYEYGFGESIDHIQATAEQALRECGK